MRIGIVGVGHIGSSLARKYAAAGHEVRVANSKGADGVRAFADEVGAIAADARGAVEVADVIILSIPFPAISKLPPDLFDGVPERVPVIDTGNYYPGLRDPNIPEIDAGMTESVWVAQQIGRPVIKAFNNVLAETLADLGAPEGAPGRLAIAVAGDDAEAKRVAMGLVNVAGFDPVDAGSLEESWRQQPYTPVYCLDLDAATTRVKLAEAVKGEARPKIAHAQALMAQLDRDLTHDDLLALNRTLQGIEG
ncbi:3-hydroxyisobutyrate dehydrogenase [Nocardioides immobilis]|uniref:3-hydroxyisobutyrate dehydrogenase n=1 Tax=Nocardioides immobilis TaxID=2049295 RepID=A0A417Y124_9ACTN|nr:3-hydroxyisobutyrate dehydrogenase [Nocardioides immobilis]